MPLALLGESSPVILLVPPPEGQEPLEGQEHQLHTAEGLFLLATAKDEDFTLVHVEVKTKTRTLIGYPLEVFNYPVDILSNFGIIEIIEGSAKLR
ncbi:hypothetical protein RvY_08043 [Ramazzottius varieornatus]|uniref:Uncharacterized protein n=1 Tax=Ramazzottius varieornatus TaxID=947166 RepID=A0A1D1V6V4_RAMVA|nr:hypothetical protein RvY_08043 [Ramazzottius varieornatus]